MRSSRRTKNNKKPFKHLRINKKRYRNKSRNVWSGDDDVSELYLDSINEILRTNKTQRAEEKGSWKIMPKDSCEVYKNRQRRAAPYRRKREETTEDSTGDNESRTKEDKKENKKRPRMKHQRKRRNSNKHSRRRSASTTSRSHTITSASVTSYTEASDMEH